MLEMAPAVNVNHRGLKRLRACDLLPLALTNVSVVRGQHRLLDGICLTLNSAGITLVMGPNGAGKSLLIRLIHGLESPTSGRITWAGAELDSAARKRQALVFQRPTLLRRSVAQNVAFAMRLRRPVDHGEIRRLLARVGLEGFHDRPARRLSGGEQQRLALARALATRPDIVLLDEPTANLDPASTQIIETIVTAERDAGTKVIFVTHDIAQARRLGDDIVFLQRGRVQEYGSATTFFEQPSGQAARDYLAGRLVI